MSDRTPSSTGQAEVGSGIGERLGGTREMTELTPDESRQKVRDLIADKGLKQAARDVRMMRIGVADNLNREAAQDEIEKYERARRRWWSFRSTIKSWANAIIIGLIIAVIAWWITD